MERPKVSIVIPVYNVSRYLKTCLESILVQTMNDIEIICVDDGSTDSSGAILDKYAERDSRIRVIHKENGGYGKAVNTGMDVANGEFFAIVESDDIVHPKMYETLYRIAKEFDLDVIKSDFCRFTIDGGIFNPTNDKIASNSELYEKVIENDPILVLSEASLYTWSGIYKLDFLRKNNIRHNETPGASYQDNGFWFITMSLAKRVWFHNEVFYMLRRDNPNSSINSKEKVYCVRDEYEYIRNCLIKCNKYVDLAGMYWYARFGAYRYTYNRIAIQYKADFAKHYSEVMAQAIKSGEIDYSFFNKKNAEDLKLLVDNYKQYDKKKKRLAKRTQKKGKGDTYWERFLWCYEDNGLLYTIIHTIERPGLIIAKKIHKFTNKTV